MAKYRVKQNNLRESFFGDGDKKSPRIIPRLPLTRKDLRAMERVAACLERSKLRSYVGMMEKPRRWFFFNLLGGIGRGIGMAIGFTILGAALFLILQKVVMLNLPVISNFIADILDMVSEFREISP